MHIGIIGSGNVADVLTRQISTVKGMYLYNTGRNKKEVATMCRKYKTNYVDDVAMLSNELTLIIICVSDDAIAEVSSKISSASKAIVAHTSGSKGMDVMEKIKIKNRGVFYPLQTFKKGSKESLEQVPICINSGSKNGLDLLWRLSDKLSKKVIVVSDENRMKIHLGAVVMNNFVNHLGTLTQDYFKQEGLPYQILLPLIAKTFEKVGKTPLDFTQTGPAQREDKKVIKTHLDLLKNDTSFRKIYKAITESIIEHKTQQS